MEEYRSFTIPGERPFRILQLTDIHYGGTVFSRRADRAALAAVDKLIEAARPDLIVSTGDNVFPIPTRGGSLRNGRALKRVAGAIDKHGIPWTTVFGNHDAESFAFSSKRKLAEYLERLPHCVFRRGPEALTGEGNTFLRLVKASGELVMALAFLDSNMYAGRSFFSGFDHVRQDQLNFYKQELTRMSEGRAGVVPSLTFFHIPVTEFRDAWRAFTHGDKSVLYWFGEVGETNDYFGVPRRRENVFDQLAEFGSCKGIFVGHDHFNNVSLTYRGIRLTYGMSIDYLAYKHIKRYTSQRGGTVISVFQDASFEVEHLPLEGLREKP